MHKAQKLYLLIGIVLILVNILYGAYLQFEPMEIIQPDGTKLNLFATGDEFYNWMHDKDGYTIKQNSEGWYVYLDNKTKDELIFTDLIVGRDNPAEHNLLPWINVSPEKIGEIRENTQRAMHVSNNGRAPSSGTLNNIVIFIRFSDQGEFGQSISTYSSMFNGTTGNTMQSYFLEASYNQLNISTTFYPTPTTMVISWQDTAHPRSYFMPYDASTNPTGYNGDTERVNREHTLLVSAVNGVASMIPSGLNVDGDGDGQVDNVCFIIEGATTAWATLLWPHRWSLYSQNVNINGKRVYDYNFQLSNSLASSGNGVLCHEMFHSLGAPDLYHYTSDGNTPVGSWDVMQTNSNPPEHMSAFMKYKYGHWITSVPTLYTGGTYTINPLTSPSNQCFRINSPHSSTEYVIVEFRKKTGTFENSLPGSGIIIYRIKTDCGNGNADGPPDEVYAFRLNGNPTANGTINSANFSTETGRTSFTNTTNPYGFLYDGTLAGISISGIGSSAGSTISFNYIKVNPPLNLVAESYNSIVNLSWQSPVEGTPANYKIYRNGAYLTTTTNLYYTDSGVAVPNSYTYYITAVFSNPTAETAASNTVNVTASNVPLISIGSETSTGQGLPVEPYYGYTYSQSIYLQSDIHVADNSISKIAWYYNGNSSWTDAIKIYMGHTSLSSFANSSSWITSSNLTLVYDGNLSAPATPGWIELALDTPFSYNNTQNLVVAVDENTSGGHSSSDEFYCSAVSGNKSINYYNNSTNPNPSAPPNGTLRAYVPNVRITFSDCPVLSLTPTSLNYGSVLTNYTSTKYFTITNPSIGVLTGTVTTPVGFTVSETSRYTRNDDLLLRNSLSYSLSTGQSQTYALVFAPTVAQDYSEYVVITSNDPGYPIKNLIVTAIGMTPIVNPPTSLIANPYHTVVDLSWTAPTGSSGTLVGYKLYRNGVLITPSIITGTNYHDDELTNGEPCQYYVTAIYTNPAGESMASNVVDTTPMALPPQNLSGTEDSNSVTLSWQAPSYGIAIVYKVYRENVLLTSLSELTYTDDTVTNGNSYQYFVTAIYASPATESSASNTITLMPNIFSFLTLGTGTSTAQGLPMDPYQGFTYSQTIYLQSEINQANKTFDKLYWQYAGGTVFTDAIKIYMGHTNLSAFSGNGSWISINDMTLVYDGNITTTTNAGWIELSLSTPFEYNNTQNLVIAFDENTSGWHLDTDEFYCTNTGTDRSLLFYSRFTNVNPASPPTTGTNLYLKTYIPNVKFRMFGDSQPTINTTTDSLTFGEVAIGSNAQLPFTIQNTGTEDLSGTITTPTGCIVSLARTPGIRNTLNYIITAGQSADFNIVFAPTENQSYTGNLSITSNDSTNPLIAIPVSGVGFVPPALVLSTNSMSENLSMGNNSIQHLSMQNTGNRPLTYNIQISEPNRLRDVIWLTCSSMNGTIEAGQSLIQDISFISANTSPGLHQATITINSNDPANPVKELAVDLTVALPAPIVQITPIADILRITWEAVPGATLYKVYACDPFIYSFEYIISTTNLYYNCPPGFSQRYYRIVAGSE